MRRRSLQASVLVAAVVFAAGACSENPAGGSPDAGNGPSDAGPPPAPEIAAVERIGSYLAALPRAVLPGVDAPFTIIGHQGVHFDRGEWVGLDNREDQKGVLSAGLTILDTSSGRARVYTDEDGLPTMTYGDVFGEWGKATVPSFSLAWITPDRAFVSGSWTHVVVGERSDAGVWSFRSATVRRQGAAADAQVSLVTVAGGDIFAASDQGIAVLDASTLAVKRWLDLGLPEAWIFSLTAGVLDGPVVAATWAPPDSSAATTFGWAKADATALTPVDLGAVPTAVQGFTGSVLIGAREADGRGSVRGLVLNRGVVLKTVIEPDALDLTSTAGRTFVPHRFAFDERRAELLVGGDITSRDPGASGGIVAFGLVGNGLVNGIGRQVIDRIRPESRLLPWRVDTLVADSSGRIWIAGQQLCSRNKLRPTGLYRLDYDEEEIRVVRPLVHGVRAIAVDPVNGHTWLGLRDELPGMACDGYNVQEALCRLKADGSCELFAPTPTTDDLYSGNPGVTSIAFGDPKDQAYAFATIRNVTFLRRGDEAVVLNTTIDPGLSLRETRAAFDANGALWVSSISEWAEFPPPQPGETPIDTEAVNDRGPHGLGLMEFSQGSKVTMQRRYSRRAADTKPWDVAGMPSNTAWDVLPLPGTRHALAALGLERRDWIYDHWLPDPRENGPAGGIVEIDDLTITPIAPPAGTTWGDVVALAQAPNGTVYALDAAAGVFVVDLEQHTAKLFAAAPWKTPERGLSLAVDAKGHVAAGTNRGLYVWSAAGGGASVFTGGANGYVWTVRFAADGVLEAGTDQGLVRVAIDGAALPAKLGPSGALPLDLWPRPPGCGGVDGCACHGDSQCVLGSECLCSTPTSCACRTIDPCVTSPGSLGCACQGDLDCTGGRLCTCELSGLCTCQPDESACLADCSCGGETGCPSGYECRSGVAGPSCEAVGGGGDACLKDCSCLGPGGCPDGYSCQAGLQGMMCVPSL